MTPPSQSPDAEHRINVILWAAMLFSDAMYYVVIRMVRPGQAADNPALVRILLVFSAAFALGSFAIRKRFDTRGREANLPAIRRVGLIIGLVLCEAAALLGVVVWFTTASPQYYLFLIIGIAGMLLHYPGRPD